MDFFFFFCLIFVPSPSLLSWPVVPTLLPEGQCRTKCWPWCCFSFINSRKLFLQSFGNTGLKSHIMCRNYMQHCPGKAKRVCLACGAALVTLSWDFQRYKWENRKECDRADRFCCFSRFFFFLFPNGFTKKYMTYLPPPSSENKTQKNNANQSHSIIASLISPKALSCTLVRRGSAVFSLASMSEVYT